MSFLTPTGKSILRAIPLIWRIQLVPVQFFQMQFAYALWLHACKLVVYICTEISGNLEQTNWQVRDACSNSLFFSLHAILSVYDDNDTFVSK